MFSLFLKVATCSGLIKIIIPGSEKVQKNLEYSKVLSESFWKKKWHILTPENSIFTKSEVIAVLGSCLHTVMQHNVFYVVLESYRPCTKPQTQT